jgi:hypothetical protein
MNVLHFDNKNGRKNLSRTFPQILFAKNLEAALNSALNNIKINKFK